MVILEAGLNEFCIRVCLGMAPIDSCLNKTMGAREENVILCIWLAQGVALLGGVVLLE